MDSGPKVRWSPLLNNPNPVYDAHFGEFFPLREADFKEESRFCLAPSWRRIGSRVGFQSQSLDLGLVSPNGMSRNNLFQISLVIFVSTMGGM